MRVNRFLLPLFVIVALFGTVFVAQASGNWSVSGRTAIDPSPMTPADLKGWMTLQQVMDGLAISQSELYALGKIPTDVPPTTALKDLEKIVAGFETSTLRDALTARTTQPASPTVANEVTIPTATPTPAALATPAHATPTPPF